MPTTTLEAGTCGVLAHRLAVIVLVIAIRWPDVAVGGFHPLAGWYWVIVSQRVWFRVEANRDGEAARRANDPAAFYLTPILVIIATGTLSQMVSTGFDMPYSLRVVAGAVSLWIYRRQLWDLGWRGSAWAIPVGVATVVVWMGLEPTATIASPMIAQFPDLPGGASAAWFALRMLGSAVTVPVAEELAFRGYLARKLCSSEFEQVELGRFTWLSFLGSSIAFGALHDRWLAGSVAGMIFAVTLYRRGKLADPIVAHATANILIAATVVTTGRWSLWN